MKNDVLVNIIDKFQPSILMATLFFCLVEVSIAASPSATAQFGYWSPLLVDGEHATIGIFTGSTRSHDLDGAVSNAFEVVSPSGYLAAVLPDGGLGAVKQLYFETGACHGKARVPARPSPTELGFLVPGYVFAFGQPASIYFISKHADAHDFAARSVLQAGVDGIACIEVDTSGLFYAAENRLTDITGIVRLDYGGVSIQTIPLEAPANGGTRALFKNMDTGPARSLLYQPEIQTCAPGCEQDFIANGNCENECNNAACEFDQGDCQN